MFKASSYQERITQLTAQDKKNSRFGSKVPEWQVLMHPAITD